MKAKTIKRILNKKHKEFVDSIKDEEVRIKVFVSSKEHAGQPEPQQIDEEPEVEEAKDEEESKGFEPVFLTTNAISLKGKIQLVIRFYGEPEQIHDNYDFIHATC